MSDVLKKLKVVAVLVCAVALAGCGAVVDGGNLKVTDGDRTIISVGRDGFLLDGRFTGLTLDGDGLNISYPNGSIVWGGEGIDIHQGDNAIRIDDGKLVVTDGQGRDRELDTAGGGAEYKTDGGVLVRTGGKAALPADYPADLVPLMEGFTLNASAELGKVEMLSGYVTGKKTEDVLGFYQPLLIQGDSYKQEKSDSKVVLRAKLEGVDVAVYVYNSLTTEAANLSIIINK